MVAELLRSVCYIVDPEGKPSAAVVEIATWKRLIQWLDDQDGLAEAREALRELEAAGGDAGLKTPSCLIDSIRILGWVHSEQLGELLGRDTEVRNDTAKRPGLEVGARMHGDDHATAIGRTVVNGVATALTIQHKSEDFRNTSHVTRSNGR